MGTFVKPYFDFVLMVKEEMSFCSFLVLTLTTMFRGAKYFVQFGRDKRALWVKFMWNYFIFGISVKMAMTFKVFLSHFSSGSQFDQRSRAICKILVWGITGNIVRN